MSAGTLKLSGALKVGNLASAPANPENGFIYYDTTLGKLQMYVAGAFAEPANYTVLATSAGSTMIGFDPTSLHNITGTTVGAAIDNLDAAIGALAASPSNYTPSNPAVVASHLAGIDAALGAGGTATVALDGTFKIENTSDLTKKIAFDASGITTATTRTLKMADANVDLANLTNSNISASAAIAYAKLALSNSIVNADVATGAAIAYSKLNLSAAIVNADIATGAAIAYAKLNLSASIANADIASAAAIALSKLAALTNHNRVLVSDSSGVISESSVTSTTLGFVDATSSIQTQLNATEKTANKGANNGYASLDSGGKVPLSQLPASLMEYQGTWDASTNTPTLADGTGTSGFFYRVQVAGTQNLGSGSQTFVVGDWVMYNGSIWQLAHSGADAVTSVNGQAGVVVLTTDDVAQGVTNLYFTASAARTAAVENSIVSGHTTIAPSGDAVFTALAAKLSSVSQDTAPALGGDLDVSGHAIQGVSSDIVLAGQNKVKRAKQASKTSFIEEEYIHASTLAGSTASPTAITGFSFAFATYNGVEISYMINQATSGKVRIGTLRIVTDGTLVSVVDASVETQDVGVAFAAVVNGSNIDIQFTNSSANASTLRADIKRFLK